MKTAVQRRGNSLALRIPKIFAAETDIRDGAQVELSLKDGALVVRPVRRRKHALGDLLRRIKPANRHGEIATGRSVGREIS
jgi:antitoxin MazE